MIYVEISSSRWVGASGTALLQGDTMPEPSDHGKYALAVYPDQNSACWYFISPDLKECWINGLDNVATAKECIFLADTEEIAMDKLLTKVAYSWPKAPRYGLFKSRIDDAGDLCLEFVRECEIGWK